MTLISRKKMGVHSYRRGVPTPTSRTVPSGFTSRTAVPSVAAVPTVAAARSTVLGGPEAADGEVLAGGEFPLLAVAAERQPPHLPRDPGRDRHAVTAPPPPYRRARLDHRSRHLVAQHVGERDEGAQRI